MDESRGVGLRASDYMADGQSLKQQWKEAFDVRLWIQIGMMLVSAIVASGGTAFTVAGIYNQQVRRVDILYERQESQYNEFKETKGTVTALSSQMYQLSSNLAVLTSQMSTLNGQLQTIISRDYSTGHTTIPR
jgi:hypothetical protein